MGGTDFLRFGSRASGCVCFHSVLKATLERQRRNNALMRDAGGKQVGAMRPARRRHGLSAQLPPRCWLSRSKRRRRVAGLKSSSASEKRVAHGARLYCNPFYALHPALAFT